MKTKYPIRINKYLSEKKISTRKEADELIKKGLIFINNKKARLGDILTENDTVTLSKNINKKEYVYYAYYKKIGVSTNKDNKSKDILSVTKFPTKVFPVGRLDKDSHGLIILTNDGRVTDKLLSPKYTHEKEYIVKVKPNFSNKFIELMSKGVRFDNYISKKCKIWPKETNKNTSKDTFHIILTEGKKRQIRRMCEALHHEVIDLKRIRVMNIQLKNEKPGEWRKIEGEDLKIFLKSLKINKTPLEK